MTTLLGLDPSLSSSGVALFYNGVLLAAARITCRTAITDHNIGVRCLAMADRIRDWCPGADRIVWEWPQIYGVGKSKSDPNKLLGLVAIGTAVAARFQAARYAQGREMSITTPTPREWTGGLPKSTKPGEALTSQRGRRVLSKLSEEERLLVPDQHDVVDAVGLGLWALDRFEPVRVFPGATR